MGITINLYAADVSNEDSYVITPILSLSGKEASLLANWFYTFYHAQNRNYLEESTEFIMFYLEEVMVLHEHLIQASAGQTHLMPIYDLMYDDLLYIEPNSQEYYRLLDSLYAKIDSLFYKDNKYNDSIFFYRISW